MNLIGRCSVTRTESKFSLQPKSTKPPGRSSGRFRKARVECLDAFLGITPGHGMTRFSKGWRFGGWRGRRNSLVRKESHSAVIAKRKGEAEVMAETKSMDVIFI